MLEFHLTIEANSLHKYVPALLEKPQKNAVFLFFCLIFALSFVAVFLGTKLAFIIWKLLVCQTLKGFTMYFLVCNVGSTSLKFKLFNMPSEEVFAEAKMSSIGMGIASEIRYSDKYGYELSENEHFVNSYAEGIERFLKIFDESPISGELSISDISCVCFKTVIAKGFYGTHELTEEVLNGMRAYTQVAPAHNPPYLAAIEAFKQILPNAKFVGSFETDFHTTIPLHRRVFGIPYEWTENYDIKKMGFHGASHSYIAETMQNNFGIGGKIISCHLGGSSSVCAIEYGKSVDCSFGFSPQSGIIQSSRNGDLDSAVIPFLCKQGYNEAEVISKLSENGGLKGISGISGDFRTLSGYALSGNEQAKLAVDVYCYDILRQIASMYFQLGGCDALVFTGGIGENSGYLRKLICDKLSFLGAELDTYYNDLPQVYGLVSRPCSKIKIYVIPTNEELMVARKSYRYLT